MGLEFNNKFDKNFLGDALQKKVDDAKVEIGKINENAKILNEDVKIVPSLEKDALELSNKIDNELVIAEREALMGEALEVFKKEDFEPIGWVNPGTQKPTDDKNTGMKIWQEGHEFLSADELKDLIKDLKIDGCWGDASKIDPNVLSMDSPDDAYFAAMAEAQDLGFAIANGKITTPDGKVYDKPSKFGETTTLLNKLIAEYKEAHKADKNNNGSANVTVTNTTGNTLKDLLANLINVFKGILDKADTFVKQIAAEAYANRPVTNKEPEKPEEKPTEPSSKPTANDYKGVNVGKNLYNTYGLKILSNNKNLTSKNLQVAKYKLNTDGTIDTSSLHSELKIVYDNLQKSVLEYYNSSEAGKAALKALGGEANLKKIVDAAWQNRAINQSWGNGDVKMDDFIKDVLHVYEEMIRSIEVDPECLTRLTSNGFETYNLNGRFSNISELASVCAQMGTDKWNHGNSITLYYELTQDANGFKKPADKYASTTITGHSIYFPNDRDGDTQLAVDTAISRLSLYLSRMFPWLDSDLFQEDFDNAQKLAMWGLANKVGRGNLEVSLEKYLETVAEYFIAYVNQDYRNNSSAQNMDFSKNW